MMLAVHTKYIGKLFYSILELRYLIYVVTMITSLCHVTRLLDSKLSMELDSRLVEIYRDTVKFRK